MSNKPNKKHRNIPKGAEFYTIFPEYCKKISGMHQRLLGICDFENHGWVRRLQHGQKK